MSGLRRRFESPPGEPEASSMCQLARTTRHARWSSRACRGIIAKRQTGPARATPARRKRTTMAYRINHIHLKAPDPRKTAEWYTRAFNFTIVNDETRAFGDRFVRCLSEGGGVAVNTSGAGTGERLGRADASPRHGLGHCGCDPTATGAAITRL